MVDTREAHGVADDRIGLRRREHLAELVRRVALQLPPADRERAEELRDRDGRARVTRDRRALGHAPVGAKGEQCAGGVVLGSGGDRERRQRGQAIQRLATEPERAQPLQVVKLLELGRVVAERHPSPARHGDALAVVGDLEELHSVLLEPHVNLAGAGVERVLDQLLERRLQVDDDLVTADPLDSLCANALHAATVVVVGPLPLGELGELHQEEEGAGAGTGRRRRA